VNKAIIIKNISKRYRIGSFEEKHDTLSSKLFSYLINPISNFKKLKKLTNFNDSEKDKDIVWALKDVSFDVIKGEVLGVIGSNGAGKSTLLKILSKITTPSSGSIKIIGRVASLLEVGTGFHPELTGRENIYLNGTILGMTKKEINSKLKQIIDFSEIENYVDTPVKRYSSGMRVRLAFSVAAFLEPEILLIDEVLAVGDVAFQKKCIGKMGDIASKGRTVLFVSHNMAAVNSLCDRVVCLHDGKFLWQELSQKSIEKYLSLSSKRQSLPLGERTNRLGNDMIRIVGFSILGKDDILLGTVASGQNIRLVIDYVSNEKNIKDAVCIIIVKTIMGQPLFSCSTRVSEDYLALTKEKGKIICCIDNFPLNEGSYYIDIMIKKGQDSKLILDGLEQVDLINVTSGDFFGGGKTLNKESSPMLVNHSWKVE
jgi:lipopolysaccharide transport system ATP-binding protein